MLILVAVDGSEGSRAALQWARSFADTMEATISVVQAWEYPSSAVLPGGPKVLPHADASKAVAAELAQFLRAELGPCAEDVEAVVEPGIPDLAVLRVASRTGADLVVVGRRGLGAVAGRLLGSVSRRVAERSSCAVAVVPDPLDQREGPVVVGVDGSANAGAALLWATKVAAAQQCSLVAVHGVSSVPAASPLPLGEAMDRAGQEIADIQSRPAIDAGLEVRTVVRTIDPRTLITTTAREVDARLVVAGSRGAGPIASLLMGSTATFLAERCDHPVVIVPSRDLDATSGSS